MSSPANRIVKNTGYLYLKMGITVFISLWTTRLVLNALGATDFGIFGIVGGAIGMLGFLNATMSNTTQRFMSYCQGENDKERQFRIFSNSLFIHLLIAIILIAILEAAFYPIFKFILNIPTERIYSAQCIYQFMVASTAMTVISVPYDAAINAHEDMRFYAAIGIVESLFKLLIAFIVVYSLNDKLIIYGFLMALLTIFILFFKCIYCRFQYTECRAKLKKYYHKPTIHELVVFAGWNFVDSIGSLLGNNGGDIVVNHYFGPSMNAAGNIGSQLRGQMLAFSNSMLKALNPVIYKKEGENDREGMLIFTKTGAKLSFILFAFLAIPFIIEAPYILKVWLKNVPEWTVVFSRLQMLTGLGEQVTIILGTAVAATGSIKANSVFSGIAHVVPLVIYIILFDNGADPYWIYLIILFNFVFVIGGYKVYQCHVHCNLNIGEYINSIVWPCIVCFLISIIGGWIISSLFEESFIRLLSVIVVVIFLLFLTSYYLLLDINEKRYFCSILDRLMERIK